MTDTKKMAKELVEKIFNVCDTWAKWLQDNAIDDDDIDKHTSSYVSSLVKKQAKAEIRTLLRGYKK